MKATLLGRRSLVKAMVAGAAAMPVTALWRDALAADAAPLTVLKPDDPTAKALGYVEDSTKVDLKANPAHKPEQNCSMCVQYKGKAGDARGGCNIFAGKSVSSRGWCKVWAQKPKT
jgi:hypothetical protein